MSPPGCQKISATPCNRNAEESFPVLSLKSREQKPPNSLLIQDKNVLQPSVDRLDPERSMLDNYTRIKASMWNPLFRKQRLLNLVHGRTWYAGFNEIMCSLPYEQSIGHKTFRH